MWYVIKAKARCEKKLAEYALSNKLRYYFPQMETEHRYQYRKVTFTKPMFPGYVFSCLNPKGREALAICGYAAHFIQVKFQKELLSELNNIYLGTKKKAVMSNAIWMDKGLEVEIISGPLKGMQGIVENHSKLSEVRLQVNILQQAVTVKVNPKDVKIIGDFVLVDYADPDPETKKERPE